MKLNKTINEYLEGTTIRREEFDFEKNERESHYIAGMMIGEEKGEKRGEKLGEKKGLIKTAKNLLKMGCNTIEQISEATGLSINEIKKLS